MDGSKLYVVLVYWLQIIHCKLYTFETNKDNSELTSLIQCILQITSIEMNYKPTLLIINKQVSDFNEVFINNVNSKIIPAISFDDMDFKYENDSSVLVIINAVSCENLERGTLKFVKNFKYLILTNQHLRECNGLMKNNELELTIRDITYVIKDGQDKYIIKSAPLELNDETCDIAAPNFKTINSCVGSMLKENKSVFPVKTLSNFRKCQLNTGMGTLSPYVTMENKHLFTNLDSIDLSIMSGSDVELIKIMSKFFNASLNVYYIYKDEENAFAAKEFIELLLNGSLDVCAGGLYRIYGDIVDYSGVYSRQAVVWAYGVERETRSWQSFLRKMNDVYMFLIFFVLYVVISRIFYKIIKQNVDIVDIILHSWGTLLGTTALLHVVTLTQKILDAFFLYMAVHLSAYTSVQLYSYLTIQGPPELYDTIDRLMLSGTKPYLRFSAKYFIEDKKYETFANTSGSCDNFRHCEEVILENKGATILIDGYLPSFQADTATNGEARVLKVTEDMLFVYHEMVLRKDSYIVKSFQKVILRLFEAGICQKLYNDAIGITVLGKASAASLNMMTNSYSCQVGCEITLTQSAGIFYIWLIGCCLSCIVFFVELFWGRKLNNSV